MKTSVKEDIDTNWDVTGDDGMSRLSLNILRIMTVAFFVGTAYLITLSSGLFDVLSWPMHLQTLQMAAAIVTCFLLLGLWIAIYSHPMSGTLPKTFQLVLIMSYLFFILQSFDLLPIWKATFLKLSLILPLLAAALVLIPVTRFAWTTKPRLTDD